MKYLIYIISLLSVISCSSYNSIKETSTKIKIYPDYDSITIPRSIAPLNFMVEQSGDSYIFEIYDTRGGDKILELESSDGNCIIPIKRWREILSDLSISSIKIEVGIVTDRVRYNYNPITIDISDDKIDDFIAYRAIEPGYVYWGEMGIYQRELSSFDVTAITETKGDDRERCVNCHSFCNNSSERFMFHARKLTPGTYITIDGKVEGFNTKVGSMIADGTYPSWHPSGRYIAFSTNTTHQSFHNSGDKPVEVFDYDSDIVILDIEKNVMFSSSLLYDKSQAESFPWWSRDGKHLYFVSTPKRELKNLDATELKYNLYRVAFDQESQGFTEQELLVDADSLGKSVTMPRTYHNDSKVSFAMCEYGTFSIWHKNSDIYSLDLESRSMERLDILNSEESESYRSFSSSGEWLIFSSRRDDGLYTRLYISHYDTQTERFSKPFMLPQESPISNLYNEKSYNIPEFVNGRVDNQNQIEEAFKQKPKTIKKGGQL